MKKLKNGWVEGSVQDFLELSAADVEYIETRRALAHRLRDERKRKHLTQTQLAAALKTSQSSWREERAALVTGAPHGLFT